MGELNSFGQAYFGQVSASSLWAIPVAQRQVTRLQPARSWNGNSSACSCLFFKQLTRTAVVALVKRTGEIFPKASKNATHDLETCAKPRKHRARGDLVPLPSDFRPVADVDRVDGTSVSSPRSTSMRPTHEKAPSLHARCVRLGRYTLDSDRARLTHQASPLPHRRRHGEAPRQAIGPGRTRGPRSWSTPTPRGGCCVGRGKALASTRGGAVLQ